MTSVPGFSRILDQLDEHEEHDPVIVTFEFEMPRCNLEYNSRSFEIIGELAGLEMTLVLPLKTRFLSRRAKLDVMLVGLISEIRQFFRIAGAER